MISSVMPSLKNSVPASDDMLTKGRTTIERSDGSARDRSAHVPQAAPSTHAARTATVTRRQPRGPVRSPPAATGLLGGSNRTTGSGTGSATGPTTGSVTGTDIGADTGAPGGSGDRIRSGALGAGSCRSPSASSAI